MEKRSCHLILQGAIGALCLITAILGYYKTPEFMVELTFFSNVFTGCTYLIGCIFGAAKKKGLPSWLQFDCTIVLLLIFAVCLAFSSEMNFSGAFFFLHVVNPILVFFHWLLFCDHAKDRRSLLVLTSLVAPAIYFVFAFFYGQVTRQYIYPFLDIDAVGVVFVAGFAVFLLAFLIGVGLFLCFIHRKLHTRMKLF